MAKVNLALLLHVFLVLAFATSSNANISGPHRRDHADLGRLVKKRSSPIDILGSQSAAQTPSTSPAVQSTQSTPTTAQTTPANSVSVPTTSGLASAASASPSTSGDGLLSTGLLPTGSSVTSTSVPTSSFPSSSSSSTPQTPAQASKQSVATPIQSATQSVMYLTTGNAAAPTQSSSTSSSSSGMSHAAMTVLIVIAASVGAAVIMWTIIRKWKFRPSSDFEGRMQPIDWQPGYNEDSGLPGQRCLSRASSFHSGSGTGQADDQMRGPIGGYGASALNPIPDHDFTAGPVNLAPVGGYADLARGPSPQPMMQESLGRAPSVNRPIQYDPYGVPLHHGYSGY